jgi:CarD family transcriptional regulator
MSTKKSSVKPKAKIQAPKIQVPVRGKAASAPKSKTATPAKSKTIAKPAKAAAKPAVKPAAAKKAQGKPVPVKKSPDKKPVPAAKTQVKAEGVVKMKAQAAPSKTEAAKPAPAKKPAAVKKSAPAPASGRSNGQSAAAPKKPEATKPAKAPAAKPEGSKPEAAKGPSAKAEPTKPESAKLDSAKPETAKPEAAKPEPAKKSSRPEAPPRPSPRVITMASSPVRPPVVAVPGMPAILVKAGPSTPQLSGPRPSAAGDAAKLATLIKASGFATGDHVVYPTHGVGQIVETETQSIGGMDLHLFVITFEKDRMTLRLPIAKVRNSGLRRLATKKEMLTALTRLKGRSRARRTMWSRRAQEYEAKINSGDPSSIAEVVRDLYRNAGQPDQSYSERQIYQAALDRLAREFAVIEKIDETTAAERLEQMLRAA